MHIRKILCQKCFPVARFVSVPHLTEIQFLRHREYTDRSTFQVTAFHIYILIPAVFQYHIIFLFELLHICIGQRLVGDKLCILRFVILHKIIHDLC